VERTITVVAAAADMETVVARYPWEGTVVVVRGRVQLLSPVARILVAAAAHLALPRVIT
jgi:uncharacterized protein (DUF2252 family)